MSQKVECSDELRTKKWKLESSLKHVNCWTDNDRHRMNLWATRGVFRQEEETEESNSLSLMRNGRIGAERGIN